MEPARNPAETRSPRIVMAKIKLFCPHCGQSLQCDESHQGKQVRCPPCGQLFLVEAAKVQQSDAATAFRNDFFEKYPDLLPNESLVRNIAMWKMAQAIKANEYKGADDFLRFGSQQTAWDVAVKLQASEYKGGSRAEVMETIAKATRQELARQQTEHEYNRTGGSSKEQTKWPTTNPPKPMASNLSKLTNLPKGMFRLWQPHEDAYMLVWNAIVAEHTSQKLSEKALIPVFFTFGLLCAGNNISLGVQEPPSTCIRVNYFLSLALAAEGILPILDRSPAKWFWLVDSFGASVRLRAHLDEVGEHVIRDLWSKHGLQWPPPVQVEPTADIKAQREACFEAGRQAFGLTP